MNEQLKWILPIAFYAGVNWIILKNTFHDMKGISKKMNRLAGLLACWQNLSPEERTKAMAEFNQGK